MSNPSNIKNAAIEVINGTARNFDSSAYVQWLCTEGEIREPSKVFGSISTDEMLMLLAHPDTAPQDCKAIGEEIFRRFIDKHLDGITALAEQKADA